jgi:hypothetical protein
MRSLSVLLTALLLSASCTTLSAMTKTQEVVLKPSQVSAEFRDLDKKNPFARGANRVAVKKVGLPSYDRFFINAAVLKGTVVLTDVVLKETDVLVTTMKRQKSAGDAFSPVQLKRIEQAQQRLTSLTTMVAKVPEKGSKLLDDGEALQNGAVKTFSGDNAIKLPGVVEGLSQSAADLKDAGARVPGVLSHAKKTSASLGALVTG